MTVDGGRLAGRDFPELGKTAEVVEANQVAGLCRPTEPLHPPVIAGGPNRIPVVERIAPTLSSGAEVIRWHAGNDLGLQIFVQAKQIAMRPDVGTLVIHKDGNVSHHANGFLRAVGP